MGNQRDHIFSGKSKKRLKVVGQKNGGMVANGPVSVSSTNRLAGPLERILCSGSEGPVR
jgi:hypothetical protein